MLPYNQIGIIATREIIDVGTSDKTFFFHQNIWEFFGFFSPIANIYIYYVENFCQFFNIKRLKKTQNKTNPWLYLRLALGRNLV